MSWLPSRVIVHWIVCLCLCLGGCGYSLSGRGSFLPDDVRIIAVPPFETREIDADVAEQVRDAVIAEFQTRGRYRMVESTEGADAVLEAIVGPFRVVPLTYGEEDLVNRSQVLLSAIAVLKRVKTKETLYENRNFSFRAEYEISQNQQEYYDVEPEVVVEMSREFARSLVTAILENF